ncbi:MAG: signal recognition particle protein [Lentisphaeria bacterium]
MFEQLTDRLQDTFKSLSGRGVLSEKNIQDAMRDVRRALLEADVNYAVAKKFVKNVREKCLGEDVLKSVTPGQQAIKVVNDHLVELLGESHVPLELKGRPAAIMLVGLHGSGKTTTAAKLARHLSGKEDRHVMLAACDLHRPAAIDQLEYLGRDLNLPVYTDRETKDVAKLAGAARKEAEKTGSDVLILDTAGRHQIDTELVEELKQVKNKVQACEVLLVADAALGQQAVSVAEHFDEALGISGIILTKMDGDARGGAALSMRQVTGEPIKFIGVGEKIEDLQPFYPERLASRILGMGDVVSLVEKTAEHIEEDEAQQLEEKMRKKQFDFDDFLKQLRRMKKMGGIMSLMDMLPGMGKLKDNIDIDENQFNRIEGIICGMTPDERHKPDVLNASRKQRIARGSGVPVVEVNQLVNRFDMMKKMLSNMGDMGDMESAMDGMTGGGMGGSLPGGMPGMGSGMPMPGGGGGGSGRNTSATKKDKNKRKQKRRDRKKNKKKSKKKKK